jgi:hypothetical protein
MFLALTVTLPDFLENYIFSKLEYLTRFVEFLVFVDKKLETLQSEVLLDPVSFLAHHHLENGSYVDA